MLGPVLAGMRVPDEKWGEAIKAVIVRRPASTLTERALIEF